MKNKSIPFMLSFLFAVSVLGGSNNYIATPVFADDAITAVGTEEDVLEDGTYIVPVVQYSSPVAAVKDSKAMTNNYPIFLSSNAILEVKDGSAELTIGVENWSYYDAFVPMKQSGTIVDDLKAFRPKFNTKFPSCLIKEENKDSLTVVDKYLSAMQSMSPGVVEESNEWYCWGDHKFGNTTEKFYDENLDVEYLTFSLEDYSSVFSFLSCTNMISGVAVDKYTNYYDFISGKLSMEKAVLLESDVSFDEEREYGLNILKGTCRGDTTTDSIHWTSVNYTGDEIASNVFDSVSVSQEGEKYVVKCHVPETYTTSDGEAISYTDFKIPDGISELGTDVFENWDVLNRYTWDEQTLGEDRCITVEYTNIYELFMGCYVFFETNESVETSDIYYCCLSLSLEVNDYHDVTLTDETTDSGIRIDTNTRYIPESMSLSVSKNQDVIAPDGRDGTTKYYNLNDAFYDSSLFSEAYWYTLNVVDETGKIGKETYKGDLCIPLPEGFNLDEWFIDVRRNDGTLLYDTTNPLFTRYINIEDGYIRWKDYNVAGDTFAFLKFSDFGEVQSKINKDGIYKADMFWHKVGKNSDDLSLFGELSMADAGIRDTRTVYIVVKDGVKKMYFKSGMVLNSAYVGHVMCDDKADNNNSVYEDSISYTSFAMDGDEIANNYGYNGYTEWGCVTGGVLTLVDDSWLDEYNVYGIAVAAPAMSAIFGNKPYSSVKKDELTVWMSLTGVEDVTQSVTVEDIEGKLGYGYQPSALLRKIKQAEIINNIGANTINAGTAFADAYAVYNKENATSN